MKLSTKQYLSNLNTVPTKVLEIISNDSQNFVAYHQFLKLSKTHNLLIALEYTQNNPEFLENTFEKAVDTFEEIMGMKDTF
jgi:hypothetical protein